MDPTISLICGVAAAVLGLGGLVAAEIRHRQARTLEQKAAELAAETEKLAEAALQASLRALFPTPSSRILGTESVSVSEAVSILKGLGIPTPGCGCEECDALRLARAGKAEQ